MTRERWRFEEGTRTIRTVPGNHWVATFDSWDGALNHDRNARLAASAPQLREALEDMARAFNDPSLPMSLAQFGALKAVREALTATGDSFYIGKELNHV